MEMNAFDPRRPVSCKFNLRTRVKLASSSMIKTRFFAIVIGFFPFVNGMMICLVTGEPRPVPTPVGLAVPSLNPDLSVIKCVPIEQLLTESIRAPAEDSFKKIPRRMNWQA